MKKINYNKLNILKIINNSIKSLSSKSKELIIEYLMEEINPDGGFKDRNGRSDLYYTFFGMTVLLILIGKIPDITKSFIGNYNEYEKLDFIHLVSLLNCKKYLVFENQPGLIKNILFKKKEFVDSKLSILLNKSRITDCKEILDLIDRYKSKNGGYNHEHKDTVHATVYGNYLASMAYEFTGYKIKDTSSFVKSMDCLKARDGGYSNNPNMINGSANATSAAIMILSQYGWSVDKSLVEWLLSCKHIHGGFRASRDVLVPDLLTTSSCIYALKAIGYNIDNISDKNLMFLESLWDESGGFCSSIFDNAPDCEYTFYGLLLLGCLKG